MEESEGKCGVCGATASTRCGQCRREFYCGREHQRSDWARHKRLCRGYEEASDERLGRHLLATRDLRPDELILSEPPLVWGPTPTARGRVCVGCGAAGALVSCPECHWPACRASCDGLPSPEGHGLECDFLRKARLLPKPEYLLVLRALMLRSRQPKRWRALAKLQSHEEARGPGSEAYDEVKLVAQYLGPVLALDKPSADLLPKVCGLIDVNALDTNPPEGSCAIYETACLLEHRCIANTRLTFSLDQQGRPRVNVHAATHIKKGEHLSTTYTHALWSTRARREHLLATKYFSCSCERCADRTELGAHTGSLKCPCKQGLMSPSQPLEPDSDWTCDKCPGVLSAQEVDQLTGRLGEEVEAAMSVPHTDIMSDLLFRLNVLLHPCHQHCLTISHSLLQMLPPDEPKKVVHCERMIQTIRLVDPHSTRLALYEAIALRELSRCPGQDKKSLLSRALQILRYEPPDSSGDSLSKIISAEISQ